ncbi:carbohydrate-binding domain-containing protein [Lacrimispora sp. NSJ-141]|uniref:Carbohydrate-binding domain-containing protein n=1 Tax=Lientehia hominis TaxID=2897778 RepID=A0AAP2RLL2_9FIRM|nr:carbohydrate-binding domain-containing protein [Lientehia hominis]MCD2493343.1 carbohydrate-binding domain-containing protein [Lientehia hominis]
MTDGYKRKGKKKGRLAVFMILLLLTGILFGCSQTAGTSGADITSDSAQEGDGSSSEAAAADEDAIRAAMAEAYDDEDLDSSWSDEDLTAAVSLNGNSADAVGEGVQVDGSTVTIVKGGVYLISGTLDDGQLVVDTDKKTDVRLILNGVEITCGDSAPLNGRLVGRITVTLAEGTENVLTDGSSYTYDDQEKEEPNAALFCKNDLVINGAGSLTVNANFNHGINSKDSLVLVSGIYVINSANDAIRGKDSLTVIGGSYTVNSSSDGFKSSNDTDSGCGWIHIIDGEFHITAEEDGFQAETMLVADGGTYQIKCGGGSENGAVHTSIGDIGGQMGPGGQMPGGSGGKRPEDGDMTFPEGESMELPDGESMPRPGGEDMTFPEGENRSLPDEQDTASYENGETEPAADQSADAAAADSAKGLKAGSRLEISGGTYTIDSADDAFHSNGDLMVSGGTFVIATGDDGMHADGTLMVSGGGIMITECYEGLEGANVIVSGGDIELTASDDGVNAAGGNDSSGTSAGNFGRDSFENESSYLISVTGGVLKVNAGGDGLDSNGSIEMSGGEVYVSGPVSNGDGALDYDSSFLISGGRLVLAGSTGMLQTPGAESSQNTIVVIYSETQAAGTRAALTNSAGDILAEFEPDKDYASIQFSTESITEGETFTLYSGDTKLCDITLNGSVTTVDDSGAYASAGVMGGMGGRGNEKRQSSKSTEEQS